VDDNPDAAHTFVALLRMAGHHVQKAKDGAEALRIAEDFHPSVVILDIAMPGMSGYAVAERIRTAYSDRPVTLVALTGHEEPQYIARAKQSGFDQYLVKPVALQELLAIIATPQEPSWTAQ